MRFPWMAASVGAAAFMSTAPAAANGRYPAANQIVFSPSNPDLIVLRATYGVFPSTDHGTTWRFLCEDALGLASGADYDPPLGLTAGNALVAGLLMPTGVEVSTDTGCNWSCAAGPIANEAIADLAVRPNAPSTVVALTSTVFFDDAGGGEHAQVYQSTDDGAHWGALGVALDPSLLVTTLEVAPSDPHRLYVAASRGFGPARGTSLFVSMDDGATWTERPIPVDPALESSAYIGGVDPSDADRVYLRTIGRSRLLVTTDAGGSFQAVLTLTGEMLGFAMSADGSKIYAGGPTDGLFAADRASLAFKRRSCLPLQCLATHGPELWACVDQASGFVVGVSTDDGATFAPRLRLNGAQGSIVCPATAQGSLGCGADANASQCSGPPFDLLCKTVGCNGVGGPSRTATGDGGPGLCDAGSGLAPESGPLASHACHCNVAGSGSGARSGLGAWAAFAFATRLRRRRACLQSGAGPRYPRLLPRCAPLLLRCIAAVVVAVAVAGGGLQGLARALGVSSHVCTCTTGGSHAACPVCNPRLGHHSHSPFPEADGVPCGDGHLAAWSPVDRALPPDCSLPLAPSFARVRAARIAGLARTNPSIEPATPPPKRVGFTQPA